MFLDGNEHKRTIYVALEPTNAGCHMHQQHFFQMSGFAFPQGVAREEKQKSIALKLAENGVWTVRNVLAKFEDEVL